MRFIEIKLIGFVFSTDFLTVICNACFGVLSNLAEYCFIFNTVLWIYMLCHIIHIYIVVAAFSNTNLYFDRIFIFE